VLAGIAALLGLLAFPTGYYWEGTVLLAAGGWGILQAILLPARYLAALEQSRRDQWRALANGPVSHCRSCGWISYNGNITTCAECGGTLGEIPAIGLS